MRETHPGRSSSWPVLAGIGAVGGLLSGLFGVGGGILMVPLLVRLAGLDQRRAAATSLAAIVPTALTGSIIYLVNGEVDLVAAALIAAGAVGGALIGSALLNRVPLPWLRWMFILLLVLVAVRLLLVSPERGESIALTPVVALAYLALGLVMGVASGLFGIGGGVIAVPALVAIFGISDLIAKGTSLIVLIPTALVGTVANRKARNVDLRTGLIVGAAAVIAAVPGALLALALPPRLSTVLFAALLLAVAAQLAVRSIRGGRAAPPSHGSSEGRS